MKKAFLAGAGIAATLIGAPAFAASGYVDATYTGSDVGSGAGSDQTAWGVNGSVALDTGSDLGVQLDAGYLNTEADVGGDYSSFYGSAHLFKRYGDAQFGVVAGIANVDSSPSSTPWDVGLEFQNHAESFTFTASGVYFDADIGDANGLAVQGGLKVFASDNFTIGGNLGWMNINDLPSGDSDGALWGLNTEVMIPSTPISLFAGYNSFHANDSASADVQSGTVGVRFNFGAGSLKERDKSGPSLDTQGALLGIASAF